MVNKGRFQKGHKINQKYAYESSLLPRMAYYRRHREELLAKAKVKLQEKRLIALIHYGGNPPKCKCCGEGTLEFLSFDHINGGGSQHRKSLNRNGHKAGNIYVWLIKNKYPKEFQILCHNCNQAKGCYGKCPHTLIINKKSHGNKNI